MILAQCSLSYDAPSVVAKMTAEQYSEFRRIVTNAAEDQAKFTIYGCGQNLILDDDGLGALTALGIHLNVSKLKGLSYLGGGREANDAKHVHVHVPNVGLLAIDDVMVLEDICTDVLAGHLKDGWRILAVCPPNGARRPDYVMGRTKQEGQRG